MAIFNFELGYLAINDATFDIDSDVIVLGGGSTIGSSETDIALTSATFNVDGSFNGLTGNQPFPDTLNAQLPPFAQTNSSSGSVTSLGGWQRKLTLDVNIPVSVSFIGQPLIGTATGRIVATAVVPEPSTFVLVAFSAAGIVLVTIGRARRRQRKAA